MPLEYKLARKYFLEAEDYEKSLEARLQRLINSEDKETELVFPLQESQIGNIPNLLDDNIETAQYECCAEILHDFAKEKTLDSAIVIPHFKSMLQEKQKISDRIALTVTSILLLQEYCPESLDVQRAIRSFLSEVGVESVDDVMGINFLNEFNAESVHTVIQALQTLAVPLKSLRQFLHHDDQKLRLQARGITEALKLPLEFHEMLSLSIDGVDCSDNQQTDDIVLVVGASGCGKSTLINYVVGVEYECNEDPKTGVTFLQPTPGQDVPAKVGHSSKSETLYPLLVHGNQNHKGEEYKFSYIDTPGFDDNRENDEAICASLGVPLAIRNTNKKIRAVIVVVSWSMTEVNARENVKIFRSLAKTLGGIIKEPEALLNRSEKGSPVPLIFAVSKPPQPKRGQVFKTEKLRKQLGERIEAIKLSRKESYIGLQDKNRKLANLRKEINALHSCLIELEKLNALFGQENVVEHQTAGALSLLSRTKLAGFLSGAEHQTSWSFLPTRNKLAAVLVGSETIEKGQQELILKEQKDQWEKEQILPECIDKLESVLRSIFTSVREKKTEDKLSLNKTIIDSHKQQWEKKKSEFQKELDALQIEVDEIESERQILDFMARSVDNVFIIRGYQDDRKDEPDHREALLGYLQKLRDKDIFVSQEHFNFNAEDSNFERVKFWAQDFSIKVSRPLNGLLVAPERINLANSYLEKVENEIKSQTHSLILELKANSKEIETSLTADIESIKFDIGQTKGQIQDLNTAISQKEERIKSINQEGAREYITLTRSLQASTKSLFDWSGGTWVYSFSREVPKPTFANQNRNWLRKMLSSYPDGTYVIPIEKVEHNGSARFQEAAKNEFSNGKYSVTYYPDNSGKVTQVDTTVFVLPKHFPNFRMEIEKLNNEIIEKNKEKAEVKKELDRLQKKLFLKEQELELRKKGLYDQKEKVEKIKRLITELGYNRDTFLGEFFSTVKSHMIWLADPEHFSDIVHIFVNCTEKQADELLGISKPLLPGFIGVQPKEELDEKVVNPSGTSSKENFLTISRILWQSQMKLLHKWPRFETSTFTELFDKVPKQFFKDMWNLAKETGLTLSSMVAIMQHLDSPLIEEPTLPEKLLARQVNKAREQYLYDSLKILCHSYRLQIRALDEVIKLFGLQYNVNNKAIMDYLEISEQLKAQKTLDYQYSPDILNDVTNSLFENYTQAETWTKCDEYGISIEYLRFLSGKTELDYSENSAFMEVLKRRNTQLYDAIAKGDMERSTNLLQGFLELETSITPMVYNRDTELREPVLFALIEFDRVAWLQSEKFPLRLNITDKQGNGALHKAAMLGRAGFSEILISGGILGSTTEGQYVWPKNKQGETPFHLAARQGHIALITQWVKRYKAEDELEYLTNSGDSLAHILVQHCKAQDIIQFLKEFPYFKVTHLNTSGQDPLNLAITSGKEQTALALIEHAAVDLANQDRYGRTALHEAIRLNLLQVCKKLIEKRADLRIRDDERKLPEDYVQFPSDLETYVKKSKSQGQSVVVKKSVPWKNLVFQGAGIKGFAYAGALRALIDEKLCKDLGQFTRIAGTSTSAITTLIIGLGYNLDELEHIVGIKRLEDSKIPSFEFQQLLDGIWAEKLKTAVKKKTSKLLIASETEHASVLKILQEVEEAWAAVREKDLIHKASEITKKLKRFYEKLAAYGINECCPGEKLGHLVEDLIIGKLGDKAVKNITFQELSTLKKSSRDPSIKDMYFIGLNIETGKTEVFSNETTPDMVVSNAVRISMSIPGVFKPCPKIVKQGWELRSDSQYVDGGLLWNYPIDIFDFEKYLDPNTKEPELPRINCETLGLRLAPRRVKTHYEQTDNFSQEDTFWQYIKNIGMAFDSETEPSAKQGNQFRSIYIDTLSLGELDFEKIDDPAIKLALHEQGRQGVLTCRSRVTASTDPSVLSQLPKDFQNLGFQYQGSLGLHKRYRPHPELVLAFYKVSDPRLYVMLHQEYGISLLSRDEQRGDTAFHLAAQRGEFQALKRMLTVLPEGATLKNKNKQTPASMTQNRSILELLASYGTGSKTMPVLYHYSKMDTKTTTHGANMRSYEPEKKSHTGATSRFFQINATSESSSSVFTALRAIESRRLFLLGILEKLLENQGLCTLIQDSDSVWRIVEKNTTVAQLRVHTPEKIEFYHVDAPGDHYALLTEEEKYGSLFVLREKSLERKLSPCVG